jgi:hypothetical protein
VSTINAARLSVKMPNPLTEASNQWKFKGSDHIPAVRFVCKDVLT